MKNLFARALALAAAAAFSITAAAQECKNRGDLDAMYCDEDGDLVADTPKDPGKLKVPSTLVFTYTPVEDPATPEAEAAAPAAEAEADEAARLAEQIAALQQDLLYARAETQNVTRRKDKEIADAHAYAATKFARDILSVADNLGRALAALSDEQRKAILSDNVAGLYDIDTSRLPVLAGT